MLLQEAFCKQREKQAKKASLRFLERKLGKELP
jgi:hypothetical protein